MWFANKVAPWFLWGTAVTGYIPVGVLVCCHSIAIICRCVYAGCKKPSVASMENNVKALKLVRECSPQHNNFRRFRLLLFYFILFCIFILIIIVIILVYLFVVFVTVFWVSV